MRKQKIASQKVLKQYNELLDDEIMLGLPSYKEREARVNKEMSEKLAQFDIKGSAPSMRNKSTVNIDEVPSDSQEVFRQQKQDQQQP